MLFLYRPRQTWMPYRLPRSTTQQQAYNRRLQEQFAATRRAAPPAPAPPAPAPPPAPAAPRADALDALERLAKLHDSGALTDAEFTAAKSKLLGGGPPA